MWLKILKIFGNLTGPSVRPVICHLKITKFPETCKSDPLMCQSDKNLCNLTGPSVIDSVSCQICQNRQDSKKISEKDVHLTCQTWHLSSILGWFWPSAHPKLLILCRGKKIILPFPLSLPLLQSVWGICSKIPSSSIFARDLDPRVKGVCGGDYP